MAPAPVKDSLHGLAGSTHDVADRRHRAPGVALARHWRRFLRVNDDLTALARPASISSNPPFAMPYADRDKAGANDGRGKPRAVGGTCAGRDARSCPLPIGPTRDFAHHAAKATVTPIDINTEAPERPRFRQSRAASLRRSRRAIRLHRGLAERRYYCLV